MQPLGSKDAPVVRALASHQFGPGLIPARCHMWVEFVTGSHLVPRSLFFLPLYKPPSPNFNLPGINDPYENQLRLKWPPL